MLKVLKIELTDRCNANCIFCETKKAKGGLMPLETFKNIVIEFPEVKEVQPQFFGEPLLHPQFIDALKFLKENNKKVVFYTNGSLLKGDIAQKIASIAPDKIIFSIESDHKELYESLRRGLKWETTLENIEFFQMIKRPETTTVVRMTITQENVHIIEKISNFWKQRVDEVAKSPEVPKARKVKGQYLPVTCSRPWEQLVVKWNGNIVLCCIDWHGDYVMGHINDGIRNVWSGAKFEEMRKRINTGDLPEICLQCGFKFTPVCNS
ncbi:MAG: radical SAM protein [Bacillota bacterium]|nr:radical SAM protein [Bacillota bacterium]